MRYLYIALILLLTAVVLIFKFQNLTSVTVSLLSMSATLPASTLVILVYVLGMVTGSALFGLVRSWIHGATQRAALIGAAQSFAS
jgi:putative membrane protein